MNQHRDESHVSIYYLHPLSLCIPLYPHCVYDYGNGVYDGCSGIIAHLPAIHAYGCNEVCLSASTLGSYSLLFKA